MEKKCAVKINCLDGECFYQIHIISNEEGLKIIPLCGKYRDVREAEKNIPVGYEMVPYDDLVCYLLKLRKDELRASNEK